MKRHDITKDYIEALHNFTKLVEGQRNAAVGKPNFTVYTQAGRKYDKVIQLSKHTDMEDIIFFVERKTGIIYGKKNDVQPNTLWFFNTIYTAVLWNWVDFPYPVNDPSVELVLVYGNDIKHYALRGQKPKRKSLVKKELAKA
jgi:hypothetical protein